VYQSEAGVVSRTGHIQKRMCFSDWMTICTQPYTPFIDERLESDVSGGYWVNIWKKDMPLFTFVGRAMKTFCAWGHMGMTRNGAIDFQAEVFVWEFAHPSFYSFEAEDAFRTWSFIGDIRKEQKER
jgi:hypothetical protein